MTKTRLYSAFSAAVSVVRSMPSTAVTVSYTHLFNTMDEVDALVAALRKAETLFA